MIPRNKRIDIRSLQGIQNWGVTLVNYLNDFTSSVYQILNGQIALVDNIKSDLQTFNFATITTYLAGGWDVIKIKPNFKESPVAVLIGKIDVISDNPTTITNAVSASWTYEDGLILINYISGLATNTEYRVTFVIF